MASEYSHSSFYDKNEKDVMRRYDIHLKGKNIAYASVRPVSSEGDGPWISGMYVSPKHRGKGLSKKLMQRISDDYPDQSLRLLPRPYKDKALSKEQLTEVYRKMGFDPYGKKGRMVKK